MIRNGQRLSILLAMIMLLSACAVAPEKPAQKQPPAPVEQPPVQQPPVEPKPTPPAPVKPPPVEVPEPVPPPRVVQKCPPTPKPVCPAPPVSTTQLPVLGALEYIVIDPPNLRLKARIDTGATTSSLDARELTEFERDGKPWVRFKLVDRNKGVAEELSRPVVRRVRIKGTDGRERPVVKLRTRVGKIDQFTEFSLSDRSAFLYPALLGRNFLRDQAVVDVSRRFTVKTEPFKAE